MLNEILEWVREWPWNFQTLVSLVEFLILAFILRILNSRKEISE